MIETEAAGMAADNTDQDVCPAVRCRNSIVSRRRYHPDV